MDIRKWLGKSPVQKDSQSSSSSSSKAEKSPQTSKTKTAKQSPQKTPKRKRIPDSPETPKEAKKKSKTVEDKNIHAISDSDSDSDVIVKPSKRTKKEIDPSDFFSSPDVKKASPDKLKERNKTRKVKGEEVKNEPRTSPRKSSKTESEDKKNCEDAKEEKKPKEPKKEKKSETSPDKSPLAAKKSSKDIKKEPKESKRTAAKEDEDFATPTSKRVKKVAESPAEPSPKAKEGRASNGGNYLSYLNREPPRHLGERVHPEGSPDCLKGFVVVMTGVMDYVEKDEIKRIVEHCGGRITGAISGKTTHLITGRDAGPAKVAKANSVGAKVFEELEWLDHVESLTDKKKAFPSKVLDDPMAKVMMEIEEAETQARAKEEKEKSEVSDDKPGKTKIEVKAEKTRDSKEDRSMLKKSPKKQKETHSPTKATKVENVDKNESSSSTPKEPVKPSLMWVDKYMPSTSKQIIGQQGNDSNVTKLRQWLTRWSAKQKAPINKFKNPTGSGLKAALLSGPPGIGKTTSAHLVCKELGLETIEMNASDTRNKKSLHEEVATLLANRTLNDCSGKTSKGHVLVMDEVDGMSGNQDRGGVQELIALIKITKVPIICICNDRSHPKMRTLVNYCFDLRFYKPQLKQIQAALLSICFKEGVKVSPKVLEEIIVASNQDIRQSVHSVNLYCAMGSALTAEAGSKRQQSKDVKLGPFDVVKKYLVAAEGGNLDLNARSSLFFHDYNAIPLFIQENYIQVQPRNAKNRREIVRRMAKSAEAICIGDTVERQIRSNMSWTLLPVQSMYSAVIPSLEMQGTMKQMVNFPRWFGNYSSTAKHGRQAQALHSHMACMISADTFDTAAHYMPVLRQKVLRDLKIGEDGVDEVVATLGAYSLQKIDLDAIMELTSWNSSEDPLANVPAKVKAKLTRAMNKSISLPYATDDMIKAKGKKTKTSKKSSQDDDQDIEEEEDVEMPDFG